MPISRYLEELRVHIGHDLVLMPGVAALIRDRDGELLVLTRSDNGRLSLPAGALDPGETACEAVRREVKEETGLQVQVTHLVGVVGPHRTLYPNGDEVEYTVAVFYCTVTGGTLHPHDGEAVEFAWKHPEDLGALGYPVEVLTWRPGHLPYFGPPG